MGQYRCDGHEVATTNSAGLVSDSSAPSPNVFPILPFFGTTWDTFLDENGHVIATSRVNTLKGRKLHENVLK